MIQIEPTKQLRGMMIDGDFEDFNELVDAIYTISDSEYNEIIGYKSISYALLSLAYDARHAIMGSRETTMKDNMSSQWNLDVDKKKLVKSISKENVYYRFPMTMINCVFIALAIDTLNGLHIKKMKKIKDKGHPPLTKTRAACKTDVEFAELLYAQQVVSLRELHKKAGMDDGLSDEQLHSQDLMKAYYAAGVLNNFSSRVWKALDNILDPTEVSSLYEEYQKNVVGGYPYYKNFLYSFVENYDVTYLNFRQRKERLTHLPTIISDIINLKTSYKTFSKGMKLEAKQQNCHEEDLRFDYPEIKSW